MTIDMSSQVKSSVVDVPKDIALFEIFEHL